MYLFSTLYHSITTREQKILQYLIIPLYICSLPEPTPYCATAMKGYWNCYFNTVWSIAVFGVIFKITLIPKWIGSKVIFGTIPGDGLDCSIYHKTDNRYDTNQISGLILVEGWCTVGHHILQYKNLPHSHAIWHIFVLGASVLHFGYILSGIIREAVEK